MAAGAAEIANAYLALTVKMPGVKKDIENALGQVDSDKAGRGMGSKLMGGLKVGAIGVAATVAAGVVGTLGVSIAKGFSRLDAIDQATAKMQGLGFSAEETQGLMDNALASVKGTAFGLGDAAGVAAKLAAGGLGPGEEMTDLLGTVANSAAAAGGSLDEMGGIFAKAMTQANGVQNDVIGQLADRGIPIYQALADQMGVTAGEVFKMASEGKVSFDDFAAAAQSAAGGVAEAMGGTVQGSIDNLQASLGRSGANLLGGIFDQLAPTIQAITTAMGPLEEIAGTVGEKIGDFLAPAFEGLRSLLDSGFDFSQFGELLSYVSPLGVAFQVLQPVLPQIADMLGQIFGIFGDALGQILPVLLPVLSSIVQVFAEFLADVLPMLMPLIIQLAGIIGDVLVAVTPLLEPLGELVGAIFPILATVIEALMPIISGVVDLIAQILIPVVDLLVTILSGVIEFLTNVFKGDWEAAWEGLGQFFEDVWNGLVEVAEGVVNGLIDLINGFIGTINEIGNFASDITGGAVTWEIGTLSHVEFTPGAAGPDSQRTTPVGVDPSAGVPGASGPLVVVNPGPDMDEEAVGQVAGNTVGRILEIGG